MTPKRTATVHRLKECGVREREREGGREGGREAGRQGGREAGRREEGGGGEGGVILCPTLTPITEANLKVTQTAAEW